MDVFARVAFGRRTLIADFIRGQRQGIHDGKHRAHENGQEHKANCCYNLELEPATLRTSLRQQIQAMLRTPHQNDPFLGAEQRAKRNGDNTIAGDTHYDEHAYYQ